MIFIFTKWWLKQEIILLLGCIVLCTRQFVYVDNFSSKKNWSLHMQQEADFVNIYECHHIF